MTSRIHTFDTLPANFSFADYKKETQRSAEVSNSTNASSSDQERGDHINGGGISNSSSSNSSSSSPGHHTMPNGTNAAAANGINATNGANAAANGDGDTVTRIYSSLERAPSSSSDRLFVPIGPPRSRSSSSSRYDEFHSNSRVVAPVRVPTTPDSKRSRVSFTNKQQPATGAGAGGDTGPLAPVATRPSLSSTSPDDYCPQDIPEPRTPPHLSFVVRCVVSCHSRSILCA